MQTEIYRDNPDWTFQAPDFAVAGGYGQRIGTHRRALSDFFVRFMSGQVRRFSSGEDAFSTYIKIISSDFVPYKREHRQIAEKVIEQCVEELTSVSVIPKACVLIQSATATLKVLECLILATPLYTTQRYLTQFEKKTEHYPDQFRQNIEEVEGLSDGWGEGDELAPTEATLNKALQIERDIRSCMVEASREPSYPELIPGVQGQIELAYSRKTEEGIRKDLFIRVPRDPQVDEILVLKGARTDSGEILELESANMKPGDEREGITWFLDL